MQLFILTAMTFRYDVVPLASWSLSEFYLWSQPVSQSVSLISSTVNLLVSILSHRVIVYHEFARTWSLELEILSELIDWSYQWKEFFVCHLICLNFHEMLSFYKLQKYQIPNVRLWLWLFEPHYLLRLCSSLVLF